MSDDILKKHYIFDSGAQVWLRPDTPPFMYSDGYATENALHAALGATQDRSVHSDELRKIQTDWVSTYHFSNLRSNLLRPLERTLLHGARVLELGCGCGAITRYLAETADKVVAVDGSPRRVSIAALRCSGLENTVFIADVIQKLPEDLGVFDVVTLVGVLEYARVYDGAGAELTILQKARSFLRPGGVLVLAMENKLGLKYFAGVPEDHLGVSWAGVMGAYTKNGIATYSRAELHALLTDAGFSAPSQFIAIPDYKLPTTILHPKGLLENEGAFRKAPLLSTYWRPYEQMPLFNIYQTWESVCKAGLLPDLADSLCFVAVNGAKKRSALWPKNVLASHYGNPMSRCYAKEMLILRTSGTAQDVGGGVRVTRRHIYPGEQSPNAPFRQILQDEPYAYGELLLERLRRVVLVKGWTVSQLAEVLRPWGKWFLEHLLPGTAHVPFNLIDAAPFNMVINEQNRLIFIDQEWNGDKTLPIAVAMFRGLFVSLNILGPVASPADPKSICSLELTLKILHTLHIPFADDGAAILAEAYKALGDEPLSMEKSKAIRLSVMFDNTSLPYALSAMLIDKHQSYHTLQTTLLKNMGLS